MQSLAKRHDSEQKAFDRLRKLCESQVVRWEHWTEENWHWDPERPLKYTSKPYSAKPTSKDKALCMYGFDRLNRIVVIRSGCLWKPDEDDHNHDFLRYSGNSLVGSNFVGKDLFGVYNAKIVDERVVRLDFFGPEPWSWKDIEWQGGKVFKVTFGSGKDAEFEVTYDETGKVISCVDLKQTQIKPLPKGVTLKSLADEISERLVESVVKTVTRAKIRQPVYCLVLAYDGEGNGVLPVELGWGLEIERQKRLRKGSEDARQAIWNPAEFENYGKNHTQLQDKRLDKACALFNEQLERRGSDLPARQLLNKIAAELCSMDWTGKLNTTNDFIAFAIDFEGADLKKNLKQSVKAKRLKGLKTAKMI